MSKKEIMEVIDKLEIQSGDIVAQCSELLEECQRLQDELFELLDRSEEE